MTPPHRATWLAATVVALSGCVTTADPRTPRVVEHFKLAAYALREECVQVLAGDRIDYLFTASEPVRFALQYRADNAVLVPLQRDAAREDAGIYAAPETRDYCLAWEAGAAGAFLDYRFVVRPPAAK